MRVFVCLFVCLFVSLVLVFVSVFMPVFVSVCRQLADLHARITVHFVHAHGHKLIMSLLNLYLSVMSLLHASVCLSCLCGKDIFFDLMFSILHANHVCTVAEMVADRVCAQNSLGANCCIHAHEYVFATWPDPWAHTHTHTHAHIHTYTYTHIGT
jgi:hypothetical protein